MYLADNSWSKVNSNDNTGWVTLICTNSICWYCVFTQAIGPFLISGRIRKEILYNHLKTRNPLRLPKGLSIKPTEGSMILSFADVSTVVFLKHFIFYQFLVLSQSKIWSKSSAFQKLQIIAALFFLWDIRHNFYHPLS